MFGKLGTGKKVVEKGSFVNMTIKPRNNYLQKR